MKAIGVIRRIDDLGRIVVPKEFRRTLNLKEGDPLELFVSEDSDGETLIVFKRYRPENDVSAMAEKMKSKIESEYCSLDSITKDKINQKSQN